jgi:hypothetical protein
METKAVEYWTRKELEALPQRKWNEDIGEFKAVIILPTRRIHDSGFRIMDFIAISNENIPFVRLSGCSDVMHIDGIGGYGKNWLEKYKTVPQSVPVRSWNIDCLKTSGLLRIFGPDKMTAGKALSSFELFSSK